MDKILVEEKEHHPAVVTVLRFLDTLGIYKLQEWAELFEECSDDNHLAKKCLSTIRSLIKGEKISERDLIALAWVLRFDLYKTLDAIDEEQ